ncbi:MAG: hypothetical protein QM473_10205 [Acidobacteriota bacterium]|nr:hypothetical protein [Acidobacteriota bacterium]
MVPFALVLFCLTLALVPASALTVRVQPTQGGPQIHVNGEPVPPRYFWGSMNSGRTPTTAEWTDYSFDFMPGEVKGGGTLHFRFSQVPGDVWLADVRIQDAETGEDILPQGSFATKEGFAKVWLHWPTGDENTVGKMSVEDGALRVTLNAPRTGKWPDFHLHSRTGMSFAPERLYRCSFRARSEPDQELRVALYNVSGGTWNYVGGPPGSFLSQVALARDAGVDLLSFSAPNCWLPPEEPQTWAALDGLCRQIIAVNPDALLVPRVSANAPSWWLDRNPDARMVYEGDQVQNVSCVSHRGYREAVCAHLEKLCRHLAEAFPDHFAGIHPCGQNTGEWFYQDTWGRPLSGYDPATRAAFREWLAARGEPDADTAEPPSADDRRAHPFGLLRDPAREKRLIDFARFQQQEMADHVAAMAAACRRGTDGERLVVFFFGYLFEFAPAQCGAPTSGHYALSTLLKSRDIDILCSPISYTDREWMGTAPSMTVAESVTAAGILWLNEDDSRTFLDPRTAEHVQEGGLVDLEQTQQVMLRNTAQAALRGFGTWWMDLPAQGWFNDARIWDEIVRLRPVDEAMIRRAQPFTPDIAAIIDEDSMCHLPGGSAEFARPLIYEGRAALGRSGTGYGQYLLEDAIAGNVSAKLQVYLSAWALTPEERQALAANRRRGITRVWCYAPGYIYPDRQDIAGIEEITGFVAKAVALDSAEVTPTDTGRALGLSEPWGPKAAIRPLFAVECAPDDALATYSDGSAAVAVRRSDAGTDVFVGVPKLTPELVRALADIAGVHLFTRGNATVWAAEGYLSFQAHEAGPLTFDTGREGPVFDALDGALLGQGPQVTLDVKQGEVRVLKY